MSNMVKESVAILIGFALTATGLWAAGAEEAPAAAADKRYVTDPSTGEVVVAPEYGGTLTFATTKEPEIADAWFISGNASTFVSGVLEKLVIGDWAVARDEWTWRSPNIPPEHLIGQLAESWEQPDDTTFVFNIRKGVHWHGKAPMNGRELTADDVEYNYHRIVGMGSGFTEPSPLLHDMKAVQFESITATDKYTVVFKLKRPHVNPFALITDWWTNYIYPPEVIEQYGDAKDWRNLVGTGPWMLTDWVESSSFTFIKNPDYWGYDEKYPQNRLPYIDELKALVMTEEATRLAAMRSGKVELGISAGTISSHITSIDQVESLQRSNPEIELHKTWIRSSHAFSMNLNNPLFSDIRVRIAMQKALDLETIANTFFKGHANWEPRGVVGDSLKGYYVPYEEWPEEIKERYTYDPAAAEALLDEAGFPRGANGIRFETISLAWAGAPTGYQELATAYWREIGIAVELEAMQPAQLAKIASSSMHEAMRTGEMSHHYLAEHLVGRWYGNPPVWNPAGLLTDPTFDAKFETMRATTDLEEYKRLFRELDMYATERHWYIWGPESPQFNWNQPWVIGYNGESELGYGQAYQMLARLWIDSELKEAMGH